jgi:two-component system alkaline phosphatase synthesis response regulator PhoP
MAHVVVVEDEANIARGLRLNLELEGHSVELIADGEQALMRLISEPHGVDLVILDWMLPGISGVDICRNLRKRGLLMPVMMLTARDHSAHKVEGLMVGADDYVTKPFHLEELLARVETQLRRRRWSASDTLQCNHLSFGLNTVHFERMEATHQGVPVKLTPLEFQLLRYFLEHPGTVLTRQKLLDAAWGFSDAITLRTVDNFVLRLRRAFEATPAEPRHFVSVRGAGYKFVQ